jgi:hypothetical protein
LLLILLDQIGVVLGRHGRRESLDGRIRPMS